MIINLPNLGLSLTKKVQRDKIIIYPYRPMGVLLQTGFNGFLSQNQCCYRNFTVSSTAACLVCLAIEACSTDSVSI